MLFHERLDHLFDSALCGFWRWKIYSWMFSLVIEFCRKYLVSV
nr:MAG TPA: hypothetical protein [Caudoviricetes sp.]